MGPNVFGVQSYSHLIELVWYMETYMHFIAGSGVVSVTKYTDWFSLQQNILKTLNSIVSSVKFEAK